MTITRRNFLKATAAGAALISSQAQAQTRCGGVKQLLTQNDFSYLGNFKLPDTSGGLSIGHSFGLTYRYVGGVLHFFSTTSQGSGSLGEVYEMIYPGYAALASAPTATVAQHWGAVHGNKAVYDSVMGGTPYMYGLHWDLIGSRLYWSFGNDYNANVPDNACFGVSTLDDTKKVATAVAAYRMGLCKAYQFGLTPIPSWFAAAYTGGKRLGIGFGGYASAANCGSVSLGPTIAAIDPPTGAHLSEIPSKTVLCNYPFPNQTCHRAIGYTDNISHFNPGPTFGYWQWTDIIYQSGVWIDMATKHGFLFMPVIGLGTIVYQDSDICADNIKHQMMIINPADLALVAQGQKNTYDVIPSSWWDVSWPGYTYPTGSRCGGQYKTCQGACFDPTNNRLYALIPETDGYKPSIAVFQVAS